MITFEQIWNLKLFGDNKMIKVGDKVTVRDGSWSLEIIKGRPESTCPAIIHRNLEQWDVVAVDCVLPTEAYFQHQTDKKHCINSSSHGIVCNDLILTQPNGKVLFIYHEFVESLDLCPNCNQKKRPLISCSTCGQEIR